MKQNETKLLKEYNPSAKSNVSKFVKILSIECLFKKIWCKRTRKIYARDNATIDSDPSIVNIGRKKKCDFKAAKQATLWTQKYNQDNKNP